MKPIPELIIALQHADGPDRFLDTEIAVMLGYERKVVPFKIGNGAAGKRALWFQPQSDRAVRVPRYTASIDLAERLARTLVPECSAGFTWGDAYSTAKINDGPTHTGSTPPLALCIAALSAKYMRDKTSAQSR